MTKQEPEGLPYQDPMGLPQDASAQDLALLVSRLATELRENPEAWDNNDLRNFLDGLYGFLHDLEGYLLNNPKEVAGPTWHLFGEALLAARNYD